MKKNQRKRNHGNHIGNGQQDGVKQEKVQVSSHGHGQRKIGNKKKNGTKTKIGAKSKIGGTANIKKVVRAQTKVGGPAKMKEVLRAQTTSLTSTRSRK